MNAQIKINELLSTNSYFYETDCYSVEKRHEQATKDFTIMSEYLNLYNERTGPRVGDFLKVSNDFYARFTLITGDKIQTGSAVDSYHLGKGYVSYSGGLEPGIPISYFEPDPSESTKEGRLWSWSNGWSGVHRGVFLTMPLRVFRIKRDDTTINEITTLINRDRLPGDHPLHLCDSDSPQFKAVLSEYYYHRNALTGYKHPLLKDCKIIRNQGS